VSEFVHSFLWLLRLFLTANLLLNTQQRQDKQGNAIVPEVPSPADGATTMMAETAGAGSEEPGDATVAAEREENYQVEADGEEKKVETAVKSTGEGARKLTIPAATG